MFSKKKKKKNNPTCYIKQKLKNVVLARVISFADLVVLVNE